MSKSKYSIQPKLLCIPSKDKLSLFRMRAIVLQNLIPIKNKKVSSFNTKCDCACVFIVSYHHRFKNLKVVFYFINVPPKLQIRCYTIIELAKVKLIALFPASLDTPRENTSMIIYEIEI